MDQVCSDEYEKMVWKSRLPNGWHLKGIWGACTALVRMPDRSVARVLSNDVRLKAVA